MAEENKAPKTWNELQDEVAYAQAGVSPEVDVPPIRMNNSVDPGAAAADKIGTALLNSNPYYTQPYGLEQATRAANDAYLRNTPWDMTEEAASQGFLTDRRDPYVGLPSLDNEYDLEHNRAVVQSNANKLINGTAKFFPTMGTTMADGIVGTVAGAFNLGKALGEGLVTGDMPSFKEAFNATVNNPVSERILAVQDKFEDIFPNWYTEYERNDGGHWWEHINANMIGDQFIKNLGFTAGAMASGYLTSAGIQLARQKTIANNIFRGAIAASQGDETVAASLRRLATNAVDTDTLWAESKKAAKRLSNRGIFDQISGGVGGAIGEARIEALHAAQEFRDSQAQKLNNWYASVYESIDDDLFREHPEWFEIVDVQNPDGTVSQRYDLVDPTGQAEKSRRLSDASQRYDTMNEHLDSEAQKIANTVFALNVPLLTFDNVVEFGKLFGGGFSTMRKQMRKVGRTGDTYYGRGSVAGAVAKGLAKPLTEGMEEVNQKVFSEGAKTIGDTDMARFYNDGKDAETISNIMDWLRSMRQSSVDVFADPATWEEFAIGALTGSISMYTGGAAGTDTVDKWQGGIGATIAQAIKERNDNRDIADQLNKYVQEGDIRKLAEAYTRHVKYADLMADAAAHGNEFVWQNAQSNDIINMVTAFDDAGRLSDLEEWVDRYSVVSDADIDDIRTALAKEDGSGITDDSSAADVRKFVTKRAKQLKDTIKDYKEMYDSLVRRADVNTDRDVMKEMLFTGTQMKNFERRFIDMWEGSEGKPGIKQRLDAYIQAEAEVATDKEGKPLSESAKKTVIENEWNAVNRLLGGTGNASLFDSMPADSLLASRLVESIKKIEETLKKNKKNVDETLITDVQDFVKLMLSRNAYYRKLYDPANNIMRKFHTDAKTPAKARAEVAAENDKKEAASLDEPQSVNDVRQAWLSPDVSENEKDKKKKAMLSKKGNAFVDTYKKMMDTSDKLKQSLEKLSSDQEAISDARAMFSYVLENDAVDDLHKLYDFEFPTTPDLDRFDALLKQYNPVYAISSNAALFGRQAGEYEPAALLKRYNAARSLYERAINRMKSGNQVQGRTNEYGEPVSGAPAKPAVPASNPTPSLPDPKAPKEKPAENPTSPDPVEEPAPAPKPATQPAPVPQPAEPAPEVEAPAVPAATPAQPKTPAEQITEGFAGMAEGLHNLTKEIEQHETVKQISEWIKDPKNSAAFKEYAKGAKSVEEVIDKALADNTDVSPETIEVIKKIPGIPELRQIIQSYIDAAATPVTGEDVSGPLPGGRLPGSDREEYHQDFFGMHRSVFDVRFGEGDEMPRVYFKAKSGEVYMLSYTSDQNKWNIFRRQKSPQEKWVFYAIRPDEMDLATREKVVNTIIPKAWRDAIASGEARRMAAADFSEISPDGLFVFLYRQNGIIAKNTTDSPEDRAAAVQRIIELAGPTEVPIEKSEEKLRKIFPNPEIPISEEAKARLGAPINTKFSETSSKGTQLFVYEADYKVDGTDDVMHMTITQARYTSTQGEPKVENRWDFSYKNSTYVTPDDMFKSIDEAKKKAEEPQWKPITEEQKSPGKADKQAAVDAQTSAYARDSRDAERAADRAELQVDDDNPRDTNGKVLFEETAIPQKDTMEMGKFRDSIETHDAEGIIQADLRDMVEVALDKLEEQTRTKKRVPGAGDFRIVYGFLKNNDAFGYVNKAKLHVGNPISFVIYPESTVSSVKRDSQSQPVKTIYMTHGDHLVGVLRDRNSTYGNQEIYGHKKLYDSIMKEYESWKKRHNPDTEIFTFSKKSKVWRLRRGRMRFTNEDRPIKDYPSYDPKAPIVFNSAENGLIPLNTKRIDDIKKKMASVDSTSMQHGMFYYLVTNSDGSYLPVRLSLAHFNENEAPGQKDSKIWKAVEKALKPLFENQELWDVSTDDKKSDSRKACLDCKREAEKILWLGDVKFSFGRIGATQETTTFRAFTYKLNERGEVVKKDGKDQYTQLFDMNVYDETGAARTAEDLVQNAIVGIQKMINPQIQVNMSSRSDAYKTLKDYIDSGYVTANVDDLQVIGSSFYINPFDPASGTNGEFVPVFREGKGQTVYNGVDTNNSEEAIKQKKKAHAEELAKERSEHSAELKSILKRRKTRLRTIPDADFMDSENVDVETRTGMIETAKKLQSAGTILDKINLVQQIMNQAYDLGVIPDGIMKIVNLINDEIRSSGYKVVNLYGQDFNPRSDVTHTSVLVHYPKDVAVVSRIDTPLVLDASGKVIQQGKIQVSIGDGTKMLLRHRDDIDFNEDAHTYTRKADGKRLEGVTTLMTNQGVGADYSAVGDNDPVKRKNILSKAAAKGRAVHSAIQDYDDGISKSPSGAYTGPRSRVEDVIDPDTNEVTGQVTVAVKAAVDNYAALGLPVLASEYLISDGNNFASMIDKVLKVDDNTVDLADLKTTSILHEDALKYQLSIYAYLFEKQNPGKKVRNLYGLHIQKNQSVKLVKVDRLSDTAVESLLNRERERMALQPQPSAQPSAQEMEQAAEPLSQAPEELPEDFIPEETPVTTESETPYVSADNESTYDDFDFGQYMSVKQTNRHKTRANLYRELAWLDTVLPNVKGQDRLRIKNGLINMGRADAFAYGEVSRGLMTISDQAVSGTVYHEAFHWVMDYILTDEERKQVLAEASRAYGTNSVKVIEEHLADDFREWKISGSTRYNSLAGAFDGRGFFKSIAEFFRRLYQLVTHQRELMPHVLSIYRNIDNGEYADSEGSFNPNIDSHGIVADNMEEFEKKASEFDNPHFVKIIKTERRADNSVRMYYALPSGRKLSEQDNPFPEEAIEAAREAIRDAYKHGIGVDLSNGVDSIHYSSQEGFVFTTTVPVGNVSLSEALADFDKAIGDAGLNFKYLSKEAKDTLESQGFDEATFDKMSQAEKRHMLRCLGV